MIITEKELIRKVLRCKSSFPYDFLPEKLTPVGYATYVMKDNLPKEWSTNGKFTIGKEYPVYDFEGSEFVIGDNGESYRIIPSCWMRRGQHVLSDVDDFLEEISDDSPSNTLPNYWTNKAKSLRKRLRDEFFEE